MNTQLNELRRLLAAVNSNLCSAEAQFLIRDSRSDIAHGRRSLAKAIKIVAELDALPASAPRLRDQAKAGEA